MHTMRLSLSVRTRGEGSEVAYQESTIKLVLVYGIAKAKDVDTNCIFADVT